MIARETYEDGRLIKRALYLDGVKHGVQREWHSNGKLKCEAPYKNGVMHGTFRHWDEAGQLIGQYEITNGSGTKTIYNAAGDLVREEAIGNNRENGLRMEVLSDGTRSLIWENDGQIVGKSFAFYPGGSLSGITCASAVGLTHGPRIDFSKDGAVTTKQWFVNNKEVTESEYASAASSDSTLPPYYRDATRYKEFADAEVMTLLEEYRKLPRVKIPLEFDQAGDSVLTH